MFISLFQRQGKIFAFTPEGERELPADPQRLHVDLTCHFLKPSGFRYLWLLEPSLPEAWQRYDWSRHHFAGMPFDQGAILVQGACWPEIPCAPAERHYFFNAFPKEEYHFRRQLQDLIQTGTLRELPRHVRNFPPADETELFILAHGTPSGLQGVPREVLDHPPHVVWLLACDHGGSMEALARRLIDRGARTVIFARGLLNAPEMEDLIRHRLQNADLRPERALASQPRDATWRSAHLAILGEVELDSSETRRENYAAWLDAHGLAVRLSHTDNGSQRERTLVWSRLKRCWEQESFWPATVKILEGYLLWLAEQHDHGWMRALLQQNAGLDTPDGRRDLAKAMRRLGYFDAAVSHLQKGLELAKQQNANLYRLLTLGLLIALDLDLPEAAERWLKESENDLPDDPGKRLEEEEKRLDWRARIAMRRGQVDQAIAFLEQKRQREKDCLRTTTVLLTFAAWHRALRRKIDLGPWVQEVKAALTPKETFAGNDTQLYLRRALALACWAEGKPLDEAVWRGLKAGLDHTDPGPAAQGILMCALNPSMEVPPEDMDRAFAGLEACGYLLEAAVLAALLGEEERAEELWRRFCEVRRRVAGYFPDWLCEVETRAEEEKKALQAPAAERPYEILRAGILPL